MLWRLALVLVLVQVAPGCTKENPAFCLTGSECETGFCNTEVNRCEPLTDCNVTGCDDPASAICNITSGACEACQPGLAQCSSFDPARAVCSSAGVCTACQESAECPDSQPICLSGTCSTCVPLTHDNLCETRDSSLPRCVGGGCVECRDDMDCSLAIPVCEMNVCAPCTVDSQCPSGVCDEDTGACFAIDAVLYVDETSGTTGLDCTQALPCLTIVTAIGKIDATHRVIFVVDGVYTETLSFDQVDIGTQRVWLIGGPMGPGLATSSTNGVEALGVDLVVETLDIDALQNGAVCDGGTLTVVGCTIHDNTTAGLAASTSCGLIVRESTIEDNITGILAASLSTLLVEESLIRDNQTGIDVSGGASPTIRRSRIFLNTFGGIVLELVGLIELTNNFVIGNGSAPSSVFGGVAILDATAVGNVFAHNTIISNTINMRDSRSAGVACENTTVIATGNLVRNNLTVATAPPPQVGPMSDCVWHYSNLDGLAGLPPGAIGANNIDTSVTFASIVTLDYHITLATDDGDPSSGIAIDIDGDSRSQDDAPDIGADEYVAR